MEVLDAETRQTYEFGAKIVFVCASAFNSTWLLMNSATEIWPDGLGSSGGELGHNAMDHHFRVGASGAVEGYLDRTTFGRLERVLHPPFPQRRRRPTRLPPRLRLPGQCQPRGLVTRDRRARHRRGSQAGSQRARSCSSA